MNYNPNVKRSNSYNMKTLVFQLGCQEYIVGNRYLVTFSRGHRAVAEYVGTTMPMNSMAIVHRWRCNGVEVLDNPRFVCYQRELFTCQDAEDAAIVYAICRMFDDSSFEIKLMKDLIQNFDVDDDPTLLEDIPMLIAQLQERLNDRKGHIPIKIEKDIEGAPIDLTNPSVCDTL